MRATLIINAGFEDNPSWGDNLITMVMEGATTVTESKIKVSF